MSIYSNPEKTRRPEPQTEPVFIWPVPEKADTIFWVEKDMKIPKNRDFTYGQAYEGPQQYPDHELVYVAPQTEDRWSRWYYAKARTNQNNYNWTVVGNNTVRRTYLFKRENYPDSPESPAPPAAPGTVKPPTVGTPDPKFPGYVFAGESVQRTDTELDSIYVIVSRTYSIKTLVSYQWDDALERNIKITREIIPAGTETGGLEDNGVLVEIRPGDLFYDVKITSEIQWKDDDLNGGTPNFPIELTPVVTEASFPFPPRLESVEAYGAWAFANSEDAAWSYSEDFFFEIDVTDPVPGPYEAKLRRFLTDDPDSLRSTYKTTRIVKEAETFGIVRYWWYSSDNGNRTFALARQYNIPPTVHGDVPLPGNVNYVQSGTLPSNTGTATGRASLPATPGFSDYNNSTTTIAGVTTKRTKLGLYEVQVVEIQEGGSTIYQTS